MPNAAVKGSSRWTAPPTDPLEGRNHQRHRTEGLGSRRDFLCGRGTQRLAFETPECPEEVLEELRAERAWRAVWLPIEAVRF
jgi:hypothetical protein